MASAATESSGRLNALDGLRGVAALAVVIYHYGFRVAEIYPSIGEPIHAVRLGQYGVALFFAISGFVIFMTLQRSTPRTFAITRFIRLYPIYWVCLTLTALSVAFVGLPGRETTTAATLVNFTMVQGYVRVPAVDGAYWTLTTELAFYVQVGLLFFLGALKGRALLPTLYLWLAALTAETIAAAHAPEGSMLAHLGILPALGWLPIFIGGIAIYRIWCADRSPAMVALPVFSAAAMATQGRETVVATLAVFALVVIALWTPAALPSPLARTMIVLGEISYPLYLIHQNVGYIVMLRLHDAGLSHIASAAIALGAILVIATGLTYLIDVPVRRYLRQRWVRRRITAH